MESPSSKEATLPVLHEFLIENRAEILLRSRSKIAARHVPTPTEAELTDGLPLFLEQLISILRSDRGDRGAGRHDMSVSAALHGGELQRIGLTVGQVVQDYGSICQSVTELADERGVSITADEFQTFNRCLDDAIAQAVTQYESQRDQTAHGPPGEQLGVLAHEMRNLLMTSMLTYDALAKGNVGIHGSTGTLLGRTLRRMRALVDRTLVQVRLEAEKYGNERILVADLIQEVEIVGLVEADDHGVKLAIDAGERDVFVDGDSQILASVVSNLVQNAVKFTPVGGHASLRVRTTAERVQIDVQDECGGLPLGNFEDLFRSFEQRGSDRSGLGLGLSISRKGIRAIGGEIRIRNVPGSGCVFTVELPRGR